MLDRDTVRRRLEGDGISYTEFSYMLLQANDYVELHQRYGCALQIGGSDQWGNIIAGVRLVRQKRGRDGARDDDAAGHRLRGQEVRQVDRRRQPLARPGDDQPVCLVPVLRQHRRRRCHPVSAVVHVPDRRRARPNWSEATAERPHERAAQRRLAQELTTLGARAGAPRMRSSRPARRCSAGASWPSWTNRRWPPRLREAIRWPSWRPGGPDAITDLLVATGLSKSKGAARRTVAEGGVYVNNVRIESDEWVPQPSDFLHGTWLVLRRGKRNIAGVRAGRMTGTTVQLTAETRRLARRFDSAVIPARNLSQVVATRSRPLSATASQREVHFGGFTHCPHYELRGL